MFAHADIRAQCVEWIEPPLPPKNTALDSREVLNITFLSLAVRLFQFSRAYEGATILFQMENVTLNWRMSALMVRHRACCSTAIMAADSSVINAFKLLCAANEISCSNTAYILLLCLVTSVETYCLAICWQFSATICGFSSMKRLKSSNRGNKERNKQAKELIPELNKTQLLNSSRLQLRIELTFTDHTQVNCLHTQWIPAFFPGGIAARTWRQLLTITQYRG